MTDDIARWHQEHRNFTKLLHFLEGQLDLFRQAEAPNYTLMMDVLHYMTQYSDLFHHPREDLIGVKLKERQASTTPLVDDLMREHLALRASGEKLLEDLEGIVDGAALLTRQSVETDGRSYIEQLRQHMRREEAELFPPAAALLTTHDWAAIDAALPDRDDPLFGHTVEDHYKTLQQQIARDMASEWRRLPG